MKKKLLVCLLAGMMFTVSGCKNNATENYDAEIVYSNDYVDLAQYKNIPVEKNIYTVTQEALEEEINSELSMYAEYIQLERGIQEGDYVYLMFTSEVDGQTILDYSTEENSCELKVGDQEYGSEFDNNLIGAKIGDTRDFSITYTKENVGTSFGSDFIGQTMEFHVEVLNAQEEILPEYNEQFVVENLGFDSVEAFEENVKKTLEESYEAASNYELQNAIFNIIYENSNIKDYPEEEYDNYYDSTMNEYENMAEMYGMSFEEFLQENEISEDDIKSEIQQYLSYDIIIDAIAENEGIEVTDEEYDEYLAKNTTLYGYDSVEELIADFGEDELHYWAFEEKVLEFLVENADITEVEGEYTYN